MKSDSPKIISQKTIFSSPWMKLLEKEVCLTANTQPQTYHSVTQSNYVAVIALTEENKIPIVRQYRPATECFTWEFPAGTVDGNETPEEAAIRELQEETGYQAIETVDLGWYHPDTGRLSLKAFVYFIRCQKIDTPFQLEPGLELKLISKTELKDMILNLEFNHLLHCGAYASAVTRNLL